MQARREHIRYEAKHPSFTCFRYRKQRFDFFWHFHPELELTYIISGEGKRVAGDSMETFSAGDLVLLGPGLAHTWVSDKQQKGKSEAIVLQFPEEILIGFLSLPEFSRLQQLIKQSAFGIHFSSVVAKKFQALFAEIVVASGDTALVKMLELLCGLARQKCRLLSRTTGGGQRIKKDAARINRILQFIEARYEEKITVDEAAALVHLSKSAFCKFFKKNLGKNFTAYVNEVRVSRACFRLLHSDFSVKEIAYECGFENISYFNRIFFKMKTMRPSEYRRKNT